MAMSLAIFETVRGSPVTTAVTASYADPIGRGATWAEPVITNDGVEDATNLRSTGRLRSAGNGPLRVSACPLGAFLMVAGTGVLSRARA
jgi:hypothetical protein